jgi:hypothetical protein
VSSILTRVDDLDVERARTVLCPVCNAEPGEICAGSTRSNELHLARLSAARPEAQDKARRALVKKQRKGKEI